MYTISKQAARGVDVAKLLADYSQGEILDAFRAYAEPLDEWNLANSARVFFKDGAGAGIILARKQKKAADAALEASTKASIETGLVERRLSGKPMRGRNELKTKRNWPTNWEIAHFELQTRATC